MSARPVRVVAFLVLLVTLAYVAGLQHQANCIDSGRQGCSVLPWQSGHLTRQQQLERKYTTGWGGASGWGTSP